jgi:hypothetical protein
MLHIPHQRYPVIVGVAIMLHLIWASGLWMQPAAIHATALYPILLVTHSSSVASLIFAIVAVLALTGLLITGRWKRCLFLLPQQAALWLSVTGSVHAMSLGQFADGVQRAHWFLIVDQIPVVLIAMGHTFALMLISENNAFE